ncbi:MAG: DUF2842 domain-containing protein [Pseudomonadota bacterium]
MSPSARKLIGTFILVPFVCIYALAAMLLAMAVLPETSWFVQAVFYMIAGLAWVIPAGLLIKWMVKPREA